MTEIKIPTDRAVTIEDAKSWPVGFVVRLYYHYGNEGDFAWQHTRVEGDRLVGRFHYDDDPWSSEGDYLYEHDGVVCRGSGAEPCWLRKPPEPYVYGDEEDSSWYMGIDEYDHGE